MSWTLEIVSSGTPKDITRPELTAKIIDTLRAHGLVIEQVSENGQPATPVARGRQCSAGQCGGIMQPYNNLGVMFVRCDQCGATEMAI